MSNSIVLKRRTGKTKKNMTFVADCISNLSYGNIRFKTKNLTEVARRSGQTVAGQFFSDYLDAFAQLGFLKILPNPAAARYILRDLEGIKLAAEADKAYQNSVNEPRCIRLYRLTDAVLDKMAENNEMPDERKADIIGRIIEYYRGKLGNII